MNWIVKNIPMAGATVVMLCMSTPGMRSAAGWRPVSAASGVPLAEPIGGPAAGVSDMCGTSLSGLSFSLPGVPGFDRFVRMAEEHTVILYVHARPRTEEAPTDGR